MPKYAAGLAAGALILAACGNGNSDDGDNGSGSGADAGADADTANVEPLTIDADDYTSYQPVFSPYGSGMLAGTQGFIFEPLLLSTPFRPGEPYQWLAEAMEFDEDGLVATFNLREGVEWNDGEPFTAGDVAFTFEQMIAHPSLNSNALPLVGANATDDHTVEVEFSEPMFAQAGALGNTLIVPEHVWSEVEDPTQFTNAEDPVGTGPFTVGTFTEQLYTLVKNENYWAADEIEVQEIRYPSSTPATFTTRLAAGEIDWSGHFVPNIEDIFISGDPENRGYWYPGGGTVNLTVNHDREIFNDLSLREALSIGMDRQQITDVAMQGYVPPAHPTGMPMPGYQDALASEYADLEFEYDPEEANRILDEAGYELGSDGIRTSPEGERLAWDIQIPADWADWVDVVQLIEEQYEEIGVEIVPRGISFEAWVENRNGGNFDLTLAIVGIGLTPYDLYEFILSSEYAPNEDETSVSANFGRYYSDEADAALERFRSTDDEAEQQSALDELQRIMVDEHPVIPVIQGANWFNFTTARWTGFPNDENPFARGAPFSVPDNALIIRNLTPNSD